ncbi:hypothetical protein LOAG_00107 [Loa loa]|uniref:Uncharacterized protein n=1 Tax=Loa loa TaxID=7209 RepID=A0A1S0UE40_LOALO|nr:hypothetical protein LOAG_00107 [Loa loa]EFO28375.1 hypothetical protein LOAG_00107 [Loa loa]
MNGSSIRKISNVCECQSSSFKRTLLRLIAGRCPLCLSTFHPANHTSTAKVSPLLILLKVMQLFDIRHQIYRNSRITAVKNQSELIVLHKADVKSGLVRQVSTNDSAFVFVSFFLDD